MKCPVCQVELQIADRSGIEIDYCPNCRGVWLDRGELDKLIERYLYETSVRRSPGEPGGSDPPHPISRPREHYREEYDYDDAHRRRKRQRGNWLKELFDIFD